MKNSKVAAVKAPVSGLADLNKLLKALPKYSIDVSNNDIASDLGVKVAWFYTGIRKLQVLLRVNEHDKRDVIDDTPVIMEEYKKVGDPYHKIKKKKEREKERKVLSPAKKGTVSKKVVREAIRRAKEVAPLLNAPIDINTGGSEISISGSAEGVARFLKLLNDGILK